MTLSATSCLPPLRILPKVPSFPQVTCDRSRSPHSELHIPLQVTRALFTASQRPPGPSSSQPASNMVMTRKVFPTACPPVDQLLSGGLKRGDILEISGPPGTMKDMLAINVAKSFARASEGVIFVGKQVSFFLWLRCLFADMQNSVSPATLFRGLGCKRIHCYAGSVINAIEASLSRSEQLVYHLNVHMVADFMLFMHNLPAYLDSHPEVMDS
jgi:RAD51-like protein 2